MVEAREFKMAIILSVAERIALWDACWPPHTEARVRTELIASIGMTGTPMLPDALALCTFGYLPGSFGSLWFRFT